MTDRGNELRDKSRPYWRILSDRIDVDRWAAWMLFAAIAIHLTITAVMATHTYIHPLDIYSPGQFDHIEWWMYASDVTIHIYLLYRITAFLSGRADTKSMYEEIVRHPMWLYLFATSVMMVVL